MILCLLQVNAGIAFEHDRLAGDVTVIDNKVLGTVKKRFMNIDRQAQLQHQHRHQEDRLGSFHQVVKSSYN